MSEPFNENEALERLQRNLRTCERIASGEITLKHPERLARFALALCSAPH
jgi:hypothetical protein